MIGLNPWNLTRDKLCLMWFESSNCEYKDIEEGLTNTKNAKIKRIYLLKLHCSKEEGVYIVGKWDRDWGEDKTWLLDLLRFIDDSYVVSFWGNEYSFSIINENLGIYKLPPLNNKYLIDIQESLEWVEDREWAKNAEKKLMEIVDSYYEVEEKIDMFREWFIKYFWPLLKDGFR